MKKIVQWMVAVLTVCVLTTASGYAGVIKTTKGDRLSVRSSGNLTTLADYQSLRKGDQLVAYCPMAKSTVTTTIRSVDSKGRVKIRETKKGYRMSGCSVILQRKPGSKELQAVMYNRSAGKVLPVECRVIRAS